MTTGPLGIAPLVQESAPLRRRLVAALRRSIETGALAAGERLIEKDLCAELAVSRTVLREALRELESEGLVSAGARGLFVTRLDRAEAENLYAVRAALEALMARQFCERADADDVVSLRAASADLARAYGDDDLAAALEAKRAFYRRLALGARNELSLELLARLDSRAGLLRRRSLADPRRRAASLAEIAALIDALERRDGAAAAELAERHVAAAAAVALTSFDVTPSHPELTQ
ncbi:GntR family transcriptional regulator [Siculibacillus lacustris]|uniref:GntR family transcriptional regulator n=1 Tax=Siculibacillus lacustris TaxID=1549641 RepID=A0A4Q9VY77_9HYPH|nr:GntR family transcriptional regulator [Siculibacillus lacustris]TBW41350.1 GntR family transcriptional regulator [Siculibacillus lacustris]